MGGNDSFLNNMAAKMAQRRVQNQIRVIQEINERQRQQALAIEQANQ